MRAFSALVLASMLLLVSEVQGPAQAYLDPGTGSIVIQAVLATVVGGLTFAKLYWRRLKSAFIGRTSKQSDTDRS